MRNSQPHAYLDISYTEAVDDGADGKAPACLMVDH